MTQVKFIWTGSAGVYAKRTLTGDVLEQRARRDGGTDFLVKSPELNLSKWVSAEFCSVLPEMVAADAMNAAIVDKPVSIEESPWYVAPVAVTLWTPRKWLIVTAAALVRAAQVSAHIAIEETIAAWKQRGQYTAAVTYYLSVSELALSRLIGDVERHAGIEKATVSAA